MQSALEMEQVAIDNMVISMLQSKYSVHSAYYLGMIFINWEQIALWESQFHFQIEYCNVTTAAFFQIRNADWFNIDIRRMFMCK